MQVSLNKAMGDGLMLKAEYTYSHAIDDVQIRHCSPPNRKMKGTSGPNVETAPGTSVTVLRTACYTVFPSVRDTQS